MVWRVIDLKIGITYQDVKSGLIHWNDINQILKGAQLLDWLEWEQHAQAERNKKK